MKKLFTLTLWLACILLTYGSLAQQATQITIVYQSAQPDVTIDNVQQIRFENQRLIVEQIDYVQSSFNIEEIRKILLSTNNHIESYDVGSDLIIFPNPASEKILFQTAQPKHMHVECFNMQGQRLFQREIHSSEPLDIHTLPAGVYFLKINQNTYKFSKW